MRATPPTPTRGLRGLRVAQGFAAEFGHEGGEGLEIEGLWTIRFDDKGEEVFNFDVVRLKKGGALEVTHINPK